MLQRDFISLFSQNGFEHIAENILSYLDEDTLQTAELVCHEWLAVIAEGMLWKKLIVRKIRTNTLWRGLAERRDWLQYLTGKQRQPHSFYRELFSRIINDLESLEINWRTGPHIVRHINCRSENSRGVYSLQYDAVKIVCGLRDNAIKIWNLMDLQCLQTLTGHTGSVLCLQYDERVIISGSSDATVRVWDIKSGELINTLIHHSEAVLHLRFKDGILLTSSKDYTIAVWDMYGGGGGSAPSDITLRRVLTAHRAAVNVVDFDQKFIVSGGGDRTIRVWSTSSCKFVRTLVGHSRSIACLQYRYPLIVSGSSDNSIRLWNIELCICLRVLEGHEELVRCVRFDAKRIVSGANDGKIKVWDLLAALDPNSESSSLCLSTLMEHNCRVVSLQFDEFQIVSGSFNDMILIWDFLNDSPNEPNNCTIDRVDSSQNQLGS